MAICFCGKDSLADGCTIQIVSFTESEKVISPFDGPDGTEANAIIPLCPYHMLLSQEGIIALGTDQRIITVNWLSKMEGKTDAQLQILSKFKRTPQLELEGQCAKAVLEARKFQSEIDKETLEK